MFCCLECGRVFRSVRAAERAAHDGCPGCGGVDIDLLSPCESPTHAPDATPEYEHLHRHTGDPQEY